MAVNLKRAQADYDEKKADANKAAADVTAAENAYNTANKDLSQWQGLLSTETANYQKKSAELQDLRSQLSDLRNAPKVTAPWLQTIIQNVKTFQGYYSAYIKSGGQEGADEGKVYYKVDATGFVPILYISFTENPGDLLETPVTVRGLYNAMIGKYGSADDYISGVYVWLGENYTEAEDHYLEVSYSGNRINVITNISDALNILANDESYKVSSNATAITEIQNKITTCSAELKDIEALMNGHQANIDKLTKPGAEDSRTGLEILKDTWDDAKDKKTSADNKVTEADTALQNAQKAYDDAVAAAAAAGLANYKEVKLIADVTANEAINDFDGTINGNGHIITVADGTPQLFTRFGGILINVAVNGTLSQANTTSAAFNSVANWTGTNGQFYNVNGNRADYTTLGALGYAARSNFGVNFVDSKLVGKSNETMVYNITVFEGPRSSTQKYVQFKDGQLYGDNNSVYTIPVNKFAKSEDSGLESIANLFFDGKCENAVIVDKAEFYCPEDIEVASVKYDRQFTAGYNAVCLPFEMTYEMNEGIGALCTYDKETDKRFWFKRIADKVSPNTPILLNAKNDFKFDEIANVKIMATPESQMVSDPGDLEEISECYGIFKPATRDQFNGGASEAHKVYCLTKNNTFAAMGSDVNISALRIAIWSNLAQESGEMSVARKIAIVDEKGVEITDLMTSGIESPKAEAAALEITTAPGEIIIASEADLNEVAVYSMDGRVAAVANVKAGIAATVDVQPGIYVVMGKKVMVK